MTQRYEREIEEILKKAEEAGWGKTSGKAGSQPPSLPPRSQPSARAVPPGSRPQPARRPLRWSPGSILTLVLIITAIIILLSPLLVFARLLMPLAVIASLGALFYYFSQSSGPKTEKRWRGQPINIEPETPFQRMASDLRRIFHRK